MQSLINCCLTSAFSSSPRRPLLTLFPVSACPKPAPLDHVHARVPPGWLLHRTSAFFSLSKFLEETIDFCFLSFCGQSTKKMESSCGSQSGFPSNQVVVTWGLSPWQEAPTLCPLPAPSTLLCLCWWIDLQTRWLGIRACTVPYGTPFFLGVFS